jgi:hypothetical protein
VEQGAFAQDGYHRTSFMAWSADSDDDAQLQVGWLRSWTCAFPLLSNQERFPLNLVNRELLES